MSHHEAFHEGELAIQERAGERAMARRNGAAIADHVISGARRFLAAQRMIALAGADADDRLWATLRFGPAGFIHSDDEGKVVRVTAPPGSVSSADPLEGHLLAGHGTGLLAIELSTRRRLRINGVIRARSPGTMVVDVREAFPNCPKYVQQRHMHDLAGGPRETIAQGDALDTERRDLVGRIDTAFVASNHPLRGIDASHRGGAPGFIRVDGTRTLRFPDYPGNSMFQTLGNLAVDPRAGLALVDFDRGRLLLLTGTARVSFGPEDLSHPTGGTGRYWTFEIARWVEVALPSTIGWELVDRSRFNI